MGHVLKEKVRRVTGRKGLSGSDVLGMNALMGRRGQVNFGHCGRVEDGGSIIDVGRMKVLSAGDANRNEVRRQQSEDPDLSMMVKFGEKDHRPAWSGIADGSSALEACWTQWDGLSIKEGCLGRIWKSSDAKSKQSLVVVPKVKFTEILKRCHGGAGGSYMGVNGTLAKLRVRFYFAGCRPSVAEWCRGCERCTAAEDPANGGRVFLQMSGGEAAVGRVSMDQRTKVRFDVQANDGGQRRIGFSKRLHPEWEDQYRVIDGMEDVICRERDGRCVVGELHGGSRVAHLERSVLYTGGGLDPVRDEQVWAEGSVTN